MNKTKVKIQIVFTPEEIARLHKVAVKKGLRNAAFTKMCVTEVVNSEK